MLKIQNLACIPLTITPDDNVVPIIKDILRGRKVNAVYLFSNSTAGNVYISPFNVSDLSTIDDIENLNLFLNSTDHNNIPFIKDLSVKNILIESNYIHFLEHGINRVLNMDKLTVNSKSVIASNVNLLIYVFYQTEHYTPITEEVNGSITVIIPGTGKFDDFKLSTIIGNSLDGKKIKKIYYTGYPIGYIDLKEKNGNRQIEYLPFALLKCNDPKSFYIDPMEVDFENSFYKNADSNDSHIPFKLTFVY